MDTPKTRLVVVAAIGGTIVLGVLVMAHCSSSIGEGGSTGPAEGWYLLSVVASFGLVGGFVDGLTTDVPYKVSWGTNSFDIGSLGDALVGATAAIAVFTVASALSPAVELRNFNSDVTQFMRIAAIGVLSGYAGIRLLNPMSRKLVEQIAAEKSDAAVKSVRTQDTEVVLNVKDAETQLDRYDIEIGRPPKSDRFDEAGKLLSKARNALDAAFHIDPANAEALIGSARTERRQAELDEAQGKTNEAAINWQKALEQLDKVTQQNPRSARAYYNKACFRNLKSRGRELQAVLEDLRKAIEISPALRQRAQDDSDFANLRENSEFIKIARG